MTIQAKLTAAKNAEVRKLIADWRKSADLLTDNGDIYDCCASILCQCADELESLCADAQPVAPCELGEICLGCEPRNADGSCPDAALTPAGKDMK